MENKAKIRINLNLREFEIEGSEDFINSHSAKIESFLETLKASPLVITEPKVDDKEKEGAEAKSVKTPSTHKAHSEDIPETFGEYYHEMPKKSTESDKILVAAHFIQGKSEDNLFTTKEANAYHQLYENFMPYKDEIAMTLEIRPKQKLTKELNTVLVKTDDPEIHKFLKENSFKDDDILDLIKETIKSYNKNK
jgi:hypothetical protein